MSVPLDSISGWAGYPVIPTRLIPLHDPGELTASHESVALRGNGRSYGDAAALANGRTYSTLPRARFLSFDRQSGVLRAEPGIMIGDALRLVMPAGWVLPVMPGTKFATLGGCVASDVHGKNHPDAGSFARSLFSFKLRLADGSDILCSKERFSEIFWATCGGMGLTGCILEVSIQLQPIESDFLVTRAEYCGDIDACLAALDPHPGSPYAAAWVDGFATGKQLGRGVVLRGRHAKADEVRTLDPFAESSLPAAAPKLEIPSWTPGGFLQPFAMRLFNRMHLAKQGQACGASESLSAFDPFFFPLDAVGHWNRLYGRRGFFQHQCALPHATASEGLRLVFTMLNDIGVSSFLSVLKATGAAAGPLSFPIPGYTLALDLPRGNPRLPDALDAIDDRLAELGGRLYLAKDSRMRAETFAKMYPRRAEWLGIKRQIDPMNIWQTELGRRLQLCA